MIIGIDARVLMEGNGGVFRYTKNLITNLIPLARHHEIKLFVNRFQGNNKKNLALLLNYPNVKIYSYRFPNKLLNFSFNFASWPKIDLLLEGCDVLFFPSMLYGAWSKSVKTVLTMHDISFEIYPNFFTTRQRLWHNLMNPSKLGHKVDKIISVSESTKNDLINKYKLPATKIHRIYSGLEKTFRPIVDKEVLAQIRKKYNLPDKKFILQVGTIEPRKNALATLSAWTIWQKQFPKEAAEYDLLFIGHHGWKSKKFYQYLEISEFKKRIHVLSDIPTADQNSLYNLASIFIYPSFYEGFGFPPLEAMAAGIPVIASATSSLGEVVGDAGLLIDPYRIDDIVEAIRALVNDQNLAKILRAKGLARTVEFDWEKTAKETLNILESV